jgi:hypothetical protein
LVRPLVDLSVLVDFEVEVLELPQAETASASTARAGSRGTPRLGRIDNQVY